MAVIGPDSPTQECSASDAARPWCIRLGLWVLQMCHTRLLHVELDLMPGLQVHRETAQVCRETAIIIG
eukprot:3793260-Alexandrium_andersonii.AAC.1